MPASPVKKQDTHTILNKLEKLYNLFKQTDTLSSKSATLGVFLDEQIDIQKGIKNHIDSSIECSKKEITRLCFLLGISYEYLVNSNTIPPSTPVYMVKSLVEEIVKNLSNISDERTVEMNALNSDIQSLKNLLELEDVEPVFSLSLDALEKTKLRLNELKTLKQDRISLLSNKLLSLYRIHNEVHSIFPEAVDEEFISLFGHLSGIKDDKKLLPTIEKIITNSLSPSPITIIPKFSLSNQYIESVAEKISFLEQFKLDKKKALGKIMEEIKCFWKDLDDVDDIFDLVDDLKNFEKYQKYAESLRIKWKKKMEVEVSQLLETLNEYWIKCHSTEKERSGFRETINENLYSPITLEKINTQITLLKDRYDKYSTLYKQINNRNDLIFKILEFEKTAKDPTRLFGSSRVLVQQEKFRKTCFPTLFALEEELRNNVQCIEKETRLPFSYEGFRFLEVLEKEVSERFVNTSVFEVHSPSLVKKSSSGSFHKRPSTAK